MWITELFNFEWWQVLLLIVIIVASPLIKALAVVIVGKFVNPELAKIALPLIFKFKSKNKKTRIDQIIDENL